MPRASVSELFDPAQWREVEGFDLQDVTYHRSTDEGRAGGVVRVAFDRPEVRNAFRPGTVDELYRVLDHARTSPDVGCVLLTGNGPSPKDGGWAFCSGGDQRIRGRSGYQYADDAGAVEPGRAGRLHVLEVQRLIRTMPEGRALRGAGLGRRRWAQPARRLRPDAGQRGARALQADRRRRRQLRRRLRQRRSRAGRSARRRPRDLLPRPGVHRRADAPDGRGQRGRPARRPRAGRVEWAQSVCRKSPTAQRMLKFAFNAVDDGMVGQQVFAGEATRWRT
jgi:naphthoate synthase